MVRKKPSTTKTTLLLNSTLGQPLKHYLAIVLGLPWTTWHLPLGACRSSELGLSWQHDLILPEPTYWLDFLVFSPRVPGGAAGSPWNNALGGSPLAKGMATIMHPGGGSLSSPATATRSAVPLTILQDHTQHSASSLPTGSCLRHMAQPTASQAGVTTIPTGMDTNFSRILPDRNRLGVPGV